MALRNPAKKFRFESFASEFECKDEKNVDDAADNDSGIDSEETQVSPPICRHILPDADVEEEEPQPLSLVLRDITPDKCGSKRGVAVKRHWKKFLKDQAAFVSQQEQEEAENLCLNDLHGGKASSAESTVAQALLSLGQSSVRPAAQNFTPIFRPLPIPVAPSRRESLPSSLPLQPLPLHSLQQHYTPIRTLQTTTSARSDNLAVKMLPPDALKHLSQPPMPALSSPFFSPSSDNSANAFSAPLKEIRMNRPASSGSSGAASPRDFDQGATTDTSCMSSRLSVKSNKKPFFCCECKKGFSTQSGYIKHQQMHNTNQIQKSFSCKFCYKGYTSLSALKMHIRTHTLPCKCDICGKSFSRPWLLQGHVRTHTGEKPFSCNFCTRSFADKSNLRAHLQTHLQTKKYSCPGCQKTFSRMSLLNKHVEGGCQGLPAGRAKDAIPSFMGMSVALLRN